MRRRHDVASDPAQSAPALKRDEPSARADAATATQVSTIPDDAAAARYPWPTMVRIIAIGAALTVVVLLALAWRFTPLREQLDTASLARMTAPLAGSPLLPLAVLVAFLVGGVLMIPLTVLVAVTGLIFGPLLGGIYALTCATLSSVVIYLIGRSLGRETVRRLAGKRINNLSERLARRGVTSVFLIRFLPLAPFAVVNLAAGASHIRLRDFVLGTIAGLAPGTLLVVVFVDRIIDAVRRPGWPALAVLTVVGGALIGGFIALKRRLAQG